MYKIGEYVVYKQDVVKIVDIKIINNDKYYILIPYLDDSLRLSVPCDNSFIRKIISKKEINEIINRIPFIPCLTSSNKILENDYKKLLKEGSYDDLISIIKTTYLRNKKREDNNKKKADKDKYYFDLAEKYLYTEFSIVLNTTFDETRDYIVKKVEELVRDK